MATDNYSLHWENKFLAMTSIFKQTVRDEKHT